MKTFEFVAKSKYFAIGPALVILLGIVMALVQGFNMGLDFSGGSLITLEMGEEFAERDIRGAFAENGVKEVQVTTSGQGETRTTALVRLKTIEDGGEETALRVAVIDSLKAKYPGVSMASVERVGGVASGEMIQNALLAAAIACALMMVYITFRFELLSGIAAVAALLHDLLIMLSFMAIFNMTINSSFIAAVLTIFRVLDQRHDRRLRPDQGEPQQALEEGVPVRSGRKPEHPRDDGALHQHIGHDADRDKRALHPGSGVHQGVFRFPIIVGLVSGTYSSIFIAALDLVRALRQAVLQKRHKSEIKYRKA